MPTLEQCDARLRDAAGEAGAYRCYIAAARGRGLHAEAVHRLDAWIRRRHPPSPGALLSLGRLEQDRGGGRAEALYRSAIERAVAAGDAETEAWARCWLADLLRIEGRPKEAAVELEIIEKVALARKAPVLQAWGWVLQGSAANARSEYGKSRELLARAEAVAFPDGPADLQARVLTGLGRLSWAQGNFSEALAFYRRELEIHERSGDLFRQAAARYNIALMVGTGRLASQEEVSALLREALVAAERSGNLGVAADVHLALGELAGQEGRTRQAIAHFQKGLRLATKSATRLFAMRRLGQATLALGPAHRLEGMRWIDRALEEARARGSPHDVARACILKAGLAAEAGASRGELVTAYLRTFDAIEAIRDLQPEGLLRSRVFAQWAFPYYRFAGYLLARRGQSAEPERDVEDAFRASERLRARSLLDRLDAAGASQSSGGATSLHEARERVLAKIVELQRELMGLDLSQERRREALQELERLEREEGGLRDRIARVDKRFAALRAPEIATPRQVQQALGEDEALLAYQVWYDSRREPGGSWLYVITRGAIRVLPVPSRDLLDEKVAVFDGLFEGRDGSEARPAVALYRDLLAAALDELPPSIRRLVIVPDAALYRLPFAALRRSPGEPPLATRYLLSYAPSATSWVRWRKEVSTIPVSRALALADPSLQGAAETAVERATDPWREGLRQGRLRFARREARALVRGLGGGMIRAGAEASERDLKERDLRAFRSLVFAAHAVVDDANPERSAVLLAAGGPQEDGLLQFREIVELDLKDRVVFLSVCRSAVGADLLGEGIMGLAHAFFQAGARAVVASLWVLRDDEQSELAARLGYELSRGRSLSAALAAAQRSLDSGGAPAAAWAGIVVLGDGDFVPRPASRPHARWATWSAAGLLVAAGLLIVATLAAGIKLGRRRPAS